ncbi:hypothetical protein MLD38_001178 [Melastoma candidum]|uniref:Uncharacterized protein n=1 Tax=Melastoma candidum TaxID=119954 RepID=A0ACB9SCJ0_9MYRT|nr:hypothetical protein MLD38_001178 [Melastoma candidum]
MVLSKIASQSDASIHSTFASRYVRAPLPRFKMQENSIPKEAAYQIINDELMLDGNPRLNLASFVTTWMEPECDKAHHGFDQQELRRHGRVTPSPPSYRTDA